MKRLKLTTPLPHSVICGVQKMASTALYYLYNSGKQCKLYRYIITTVKTYPLRKQLHKAWHLILIWSRISSSNILEGFGVHRKYAHDSNLQHDWFSNISCSGDYTENGIFLWILRIHLRTPSKCMQVRAFWKSAKVMADGYKKPCSSLESVTRKMYARSMK